GAGSGLIADEKIDGSGKNPLSVFDRDQQLINVVAVNVDTITDGGGKENLLPTKDPFSSDQTVTRDSGRSNVSKRDLISEGNDDFRAAFVKDSGEAQHVSNEQWRQTLEVNRTGHGDFGFATENWDVVYKRDDGKSPSDVEKEKKRQVTNPNDNARTFDQMSIN